MRLGPEVNTVRRVLPPSQPPPAGGRSQVPAPGGRGSGKGPAPCPRSRGAGVPPALPGRLQRARCAMRLGPEVNTVRRVLPPSPALPPLGGGAGFPPPAGEGQGRGRRHARGAVARAGRPRHRPMFTSAVHAAPPHNAAMNIRLFLGGLRPPKPSRGWGHGETGFPHAPAGRGRGETRFPHTPGAYFHVSRPCGSAAQHRNEHKVVPGRA